VDKLPPREVLEEIDSQVNWQHMEDTLMAEGVKKFADPQKELLALIAEKLRSLAIA
jgi:transaldolase